MKEIKGDLIQLALEGQFDVIAHGCNCFCTMKSGIAPQMDKRFGCNTWSLEDTSEMGNINKLGQIQYKNFLVSQCGVIPADFKGITTQELKYPLTVVNAYTQYSYSTTGNHLDYDLMLT